MSYALSDVEISSLNLTVQASSSMEPAISKGDIVIVEKNTDDIQVGDIIIYKPSWFPEPVLHRVISIKNESKGTVLYQAKGDNNPSPDPELLTKSQIKAKVVTMNNNSLIIPQLGYITLWLQTS